jgi:hypothetical protein
MTPLAREDAEEIAIVWHRIAALVLWALFVRFRDKRVNRAIELVLGAVPVQTIVLASIADQFLRELLGDVTRRVRKILLLRFDQVAARIHGGKFIPAYAAK